MWRAEPPGGDESRDAVYLEWARNDICSELPRSSIHFRTVCGRMMAHILPAPSTHAATVGWRYRKQALMKPDCNDRRPAAPSLGSTASGAHPRHRGACDQPTPAASPQAIRGRLSVVCGAMDQAGSVAGTDTDPSVALELEFQSNDTPVDVRCYPQSGLHATAAPVCAASPRPPLGLPSDGARRRRAKTLLALQDGSGDPAPPERLRPGACRCRR